MVSENFKNLSKDIYINTHHYDNPFAQKNSLFYVRLLAIKNNWIAYKGVTGNVRFMEFEEFFNTFSRPKMYYGKVLSYFAIGMHILDCKELKKEFYKGSLWAFGRSNEDYFSEKYSGKFVEELRKLLE